MAGAYRVAHTPWADAMSGAPAAASNGRVIVNVDPWS